MTDIRGLPANIWLTDTDLPATADAPLKTQGGVTLDDGSGNMTLPAYATFGASGGGGIAVPDSSSATGLFHADAYNGIVEIGSSTGQEPIVLDGAVNVYAGSGAPTLDAPRPAFYFRSDGGTGTHIYFTSGGTTWTALV